MLRAWLVNQNNISNDSTVYTTIGINSAKPRYKRMDITTHAEMHAVSKLSRKMVLFHKKHMTVDLYVIKVGANGILKQSAPCRHCIIELTKLTKITIRNIHFSNQRGEIESHHFAQWHQTTQPYTSYGWRKCNRHR